MDDVIIVGAGLAGLTCAHQLSAQQLDVRVFEQSNRVGGRIRTNRDLGAPVELGASFMAGFYGNIRSLVKSLRLTENSGGDSQETWLAEGNGKAAPIWPASELARSAALTWPEKARALPGVVKLALDGRRIHRLEASQAIPFDDTSVSRWGKVWFGKAFSESVVEPLLQALFFWDTDRTSRGLLPLVVKGVRSDRKFYRLHDGMDQICSGLAKNLSVTLKCTVNSIAVKDNGFEVRTSEGHFSTKAVVLACPAPIAVAILDASEQISTPDALREVNYSRGRVGLIQLPEGAVWPLTTRRSIVVRQSASDSLVAVKPFFSASDDFAGLRYYLSEKVIGRASNGSIPMVKRELERLGLVELARVIPSMSSPLEEIDWEYALPSFDVGYLKRVARGDLGDGLPEGLFLAGDYLVAPHLDGACESGLVAAEATYSFVNANR